MFICKQGYEHMQMSVNCQDFGFDSEFKCVVDGCSEGKHSEVGAKLFCHLFKDCNPDVDDVPLVFEHMMSLIGDSSSDIKDFMCFTILFVYETTDEFVVNVCGDGYIIKERKDGIIEYVKLDNGEYPKYFAYNYIPKDKLTQYKDGVSFTELRYSKEDYSAIGVASDGLRFVLDTAYQREMENNIVHRKEFAIRRLINREWSTFKDDISITI